MAKKVLWASGALLFVAMGCFCAGGPERQLLPEPLKAVSLGSSVESLQSTRPAVSADACDDDHLGPQYVCMVESEPSDALSSVYYRFKDDQLERISLGYDGLDCSETLVDERLAAFVEADSLLGPREASLETYEAARHLYVRWASEEVNARLKVTVFDGVLLNTMLENDSEVGGATCMTMFELTGPTVGHLDLPGERMDLEAAKAELWAFAGRVEARAALIVKLALQPLDETVCAEMNEWVDIPTPFCHGLVEAVQSGRTSSAGRGHLTSYLEERGYREFNGFMVAKVDDGFYEVVKVYYHRYYGWQPTSDDHLVLKTTATTYTSRGRFKLWVKTVGTEQIETSNGFVQTWEVIEEDELGTAVKNVFEAPAGTATSDAAREVLIALLRGSVE